MSDDAGATTHHYEVVFTRAAKRAIELELPIKIATAVFEFITGPLRQNPHRLGKPLRGPISGLHSARRADYRVVYKIVDDQLIIYVISIAHRRDAYR